ncbi:hypothetical protein [Bacillus sp. JJ722]|uniref:hypothetical protein n=1 Tax=Bacillus sp. JJ722 TaxID=3122973 RepID=UPI002FFEA4D5
MVTIHFFENKTLVLSQLVNNVPSVNDEIKIKGRKGKVLRVNNVKDNVIHVHILFDQVIKTKPLAFDNKKKKR